jgi:hypothetical protein
MRQEQQTCMTKNKIKLIWCCGYKKLVAKNLTRKIEGVGLG